MLKTFMVGDHVRWNSEAGLVSGVIVKELTHDTQFKGYTHHASRESQYLIKSDKTDHVAIHKATALEKTKLEFRSEFFNAFNLVSFANPLNIVQSATVGQIVSTTIGPRVIQFALKFNF
jgi:hypothetical protein